MNKKLIFVMLGMLILVQTVSASTMITMSGEKQSQETILGIKLDGDYYTAIIEDKKLIKLELNGIESPEYTIETSKDKLIDFALKYPEMNKVEKIRYILEEFNIPFNLMMRIAGGGLN